MWQFVLKGKKGKGWSGGGGSADTGDAFLRYHCKLDTLRIFQSLIELCPASHWRERSSVFAVDRSAFQPKSFASAEETGQRNTGPAFYTTLLFSSLIYIMDLPWTSSEIESLHDCADCWKSVSQSYYPFVLCDAPRISTLRTVCRCDCRCSWEHLGKYQVALSTIYRSTYLEDYRILLSPKIYVTDDVNQNINS